MRSNWSPNLIELIKGLYVNQHLSAGMITQILNEKAIKIANYQVRHIIRKLNITRTQSDAAILRIKRQNNKWFKHYKSKICKYCKESFEPTSRKQFYCKNCNTKGLLSSYGITSSDYDLLRQRQSNDCGVCQISLEELPTQQIHLDHDHQTGIIRGILCRKCNLRLGCVDNKEWLSLAISYLSKPGIVPRVKGASMNKGIVHKWQELE